MRARIRSAHVHVRVVPPAVAARRAPEHPVLPCVSPERPLARPAPRCPPSAGRCCCSASAPTAPCPGCGEAEAGCGVVGYGQRTRARALGDGQRGGRGEQFGRGRVVGEPQEPVDRCGLNPVDMTTSHDEGPIITRRSRGRRWWCKLCATRISLFTFLLMRKDLLPHPCTLCINTPCNTSSYRSHARTYL